MKKYARINIILRKDYDPDEVRGVVDSFSDYAELNELMRMASFYGEAEKGQEFVRAIEAVEPISSVTMRTYNY